MLVAREIRTIVRATRRIALAELERFSLVGFSMGGRTVCRGCSADDAARSYILPVDEVRGLNDDELRAWWSERFIALATETDAEKRIRTLISVLRASQQVEPAERRRLTRARMRAAIALPPPVRDLVFATRAAAAKREPALVADDEVVVQELIPTIPEAAGFRPQGS